MNIKHFRPKNSLVEAVRLEGDVNWIAVARWCKGNIQKAKDGQTDRNRIRIPHWEMDDLIGWHVAYCGDWILRLPDTKEFITKTQQEMEAEYEES
jgi:hypothetical protein